MLEVIEKILILQDRAYAPQTITRHIARTRIGCGADELCSLGLCVRVVGASTEPEPSPDGGATRDGGGSRDGGTRDGGNAADGGQTVDGGSTVDGGRHDDPGLRALADAKRNFPVPMEAFGELIDGCVADVRGTRYETFEDLHHYCRCVAGSIGRLSLGIFGTRHDQQEAARLADSLGVALQLTNILRDIREDHQNGRVYLPAEDLAKFDIDLDAPSASQFIRLMEFEAERARDWYAAGWQLLPMLDRRSAACTGAMAGIYRRLLEQIATQPAAVLDSRVSLSTGEKAMVAVRALAGRIR